MTVHQFEAGAAGAQGYAINWDTAETRVKELKAYLMNAPQVMDPERLQFLNEVYEEFQGEPVFYIRAKLLERVLLKKRSFWTATPSWGRLPERVPVCMPIPSGMFLGSRKKCRWPRWPRWAK